MMAIDLVINPALDVPIYQQLYDKLSSMIVSGKLESGACLPPIRTVAKELSISVIPVKRAWEELENEGLICTVTGKGCFVASLPSADREQKRDAFVSARLLQELRYYKSLGLSLDEYIDIVKKHY